MKRFSTRLSSVFILLIGLSILSSDLIIISVVEDSHLKAAKEAMQRELFLIVRDLATPEDTGLEERLARYGRIAADTDRLLGARVTIIGGDGTVLADSRLSPDGTDNHAERAEIRQAKSEGIGFSLRKSESLDRDLLYAAMPISYDETGSPESYVRIAFGMDMLDQTKSRLHRLAAIWLMAFMLISGMVSYRIAKGLSRPLERAVNAARKIARQQFDVRLPEDGKDEFAQLGRAINIMADSLQNQMEAARAGGKRLSSVLDTMISGVMLVDSSGTIQLANRKAEDLLGFSSRELVGRSFGEARAPSEFPPELAVLVRNCLERRDALREELTFHYPEERIIEASLVPIGLQEADDGIVIVLHDITEIRRLERVRSQFVANVSHELRTPVAAIRGYAETLKAGAIHDAEIADSFLQIILDESRRLGRLIDDILDLSKIESKQVSMQFAPVDLRSFIGKTIGTVQPAADHKKLRLSWQVEEHLHIEADEDKLGQILLNLLSNAIAYTPEGGSVTVKAYAVPAEGGGDDERVRIEVRDTGIGIPRKDLPRIFERFYRVDKARSRGSGGTGLGLSIVKHLVELHHGSITVESKPGAGSVFTVELPFIQPWDES